MERESEYPASIEAPRGAAQRGRWDGAASVRACGACGAPRHGNMPRVTTDPTSSPARASAATARAHPLAVVLTSVLVAPLWGTRCFSRAARHAGRDCISTAVASRSIESSRPRSPTTIAACASTCRARTHPTRPRRRYPVVYLLHGWPGGDGNWPGQGHAIETLDSLIANGSIPEVIAVMPNGRGIGLFGRSLYLNTYDGKSRMEDFIAHDLVSWVDRHVPHARRLVASRRDRAVGRRDRIAQSRVQASRHLRRVRRTQRSVRAGSATSAWARCSGPSPAPRGSQREQPDAVRGVGRPRIRGVNIYFDCGTHDGELEDNRRSTARSTR